MRHLFFAYINTASVYLFLAQFTVMQSTLHHYQETLPSPVSRYRISNLPTPACSLHRPSLAYTIATPPSHPPTTTHLTLPTRKLPFSPVLPTPLHIPYHRPTTPPKPYSRPRSILTMATPNMQTLALQ